MEAGWTTLLVVLGLVACVLGQSKVEQSDDGSSGTISFSTPTLDDDDAHSPWMPDQLRCDACVIITFKLWRAFQIYNDKRKSLKYNIPESELLDITDNVCNDEESWKDYGVKEIKKVKRLSGPGLETNEVPGVLAGGGKWPARIQDMCEIYMGDVGETQIYKIYKKNPKSRKKLEDYLCRGKGVHGECTRVEKAQKDEL